jgi:hypothetical protein
MNAIRKAEEHLKAAAGILSKSALMQRFRRAREIIREADKRAEEGAKAAIEGIKKTAE